ncbi:MAG: glycosyltransferase [Lachnospiraceae bacterium]
MDEARIQILIPTINQLVELEETIKSIKNQEYDLDNIYITVVDFGSTDGTYEKLLQYNHRNFGIYRIVVKNENQRIAEAGKILKYVWPGGAYCFAVIVYPGERLYPHCLRTLITKYLGNGCKNIKMVICECDVFMENGTITHQKPLFEEDRIIDGSRDINEYIKRGYMHQIFHMGGYFNIDRYKANSESNERRYWNKLAREAQENNVLYIKEALACTKAVVYSNEFKEILYRWEAIISIVRAYFSKFGDSFNEEFEKFAYHNLSEYALWRSFLLYKRGIHTKETEDCFLISSVIDQEIVYEEIYEHMYKLIFEDKLDEQEWLQKYYSQKQ